MKTDPSVKQLYNRLVQIRHGMQLMPYSNCDVENTLAGVCQCLGRRVRLVGMASVGVVIMGLLGVLSGGLSPRHTLWQWALLNGSSGASPDVLQVTLDQPAFPIPKAPTAAISVNQTVRLETESLLPHESEL